jgi:hypothetical protein
MTVKDTQSKTTHYSGFVTERKAVVFSLIHSVVAASYISIFIGFSITWMLFEPEKVRVFRDQVVNQSLGFEIFVFVIPTLVASLGYLLWGIPNIIYGRCEECGHEINLGRLYCGHCGSLITKSRKLSYQIAWLVFGYSAFVPVVTLAGLFSFAFLLSYFAPLSVYPTISVSLTTMPLFIPIIPGPVLYVILVFVSLASLGVSSLIRRLVVRVSS